MGKYLAGEPTETESGSVALVEVAQCFDSPLSKSGPEAVRAMLHPDDVEPVLDELMRDAGLLKITTDSPIEDVTDCLRRLSKAVSRVDPLRKEAARAAAVAALKEKRFRAPARLVSAAFADETDDRRAPAFQRESQATQLVRLAQESGAEFFHTPDEDPYVTAVVNGHPETYLMRGRRARDWLSRGYYRRYGSAPTANAWADASNTLAGIARFEGAERRVHTRLAAVGSELYVDLGRPDWKVIRVTPAGWEIVQAGDVRFRRPRGLQPLPIPSRDGSVEKLRPLANLQSDQDFCLAVSWLLGAFRGRSPYPVLAIEREQGSAKTSLSRRLRACIDPNRAPLRLPPRQPRDLMIAALNSHVLAFDNVSVLPEWLSDVLCCLTSETGFSTRELYSDSDELLFSAARPVLLNGITDVATRPDLLDRSIVLTLEAIPDTDRRTEEELDQEFLEVQPLILGGLMDALTCALSSERRVTLSRLPRMADFCRFVTAAEAALPWPAGDFLEAYTGNRDRVVEDALNGDPLADFVQALAPWSGTASDLLAALERQTPAQVKQRPGWFRSPRRVSGRLRRLAPALRRKGIDVLMGPREREAHTGRRIIRLSRELDGRQRPSPVSPSLSISSKSQPAKEDRGVGRTQR